MMRKEVMADEVHGTRLSGADDPEGRGDGPRRSVSRHGLRLRQDRHRSDCHHQVCLYTYQGVT